MRYLPVFSLLFFFVIAAFDTQPVRAWRLSGQAQGTTWHITFYATDSLVTQQQISALLDQIDSSLSIYKSYSLITRFNLGNSPVVMDNHMATVVNKALETTRQTEGIFDITVQPLVQAWGFGTSKQAAMPDSAAIRAIRQCVGSEKLSVKGRQLAKAMPCTRIDVNGIAQGYSVDVVAAFLDSKNIQSYIVEIGGEIRIKGRKQPSGDKMKIGIEAPGEDPMRPDVLQKIVSLDNGAITTSGSYRKFYESEGKKISHIIDPSTGYPSGNELISVTVYAADAITADAYDNALMVMGLKKALQFVEARNDMAAYFIYRAPDGTIADTATKLFYKFMQ